MKCSRCKVPNDKIHGPFKEVGYQYGMKSICLCRKCYHTLCKNYPVDIIFCDPADRKKDILKVQLIEKFIHWNKEE